LKKSWVLPWIASLNKIHLCLSLPLGIVREGCLGNNQ
jgi:hypothetical protein